MTDISRGHRHTVSLRKGQHHFLSHSGVHGSVLERWRRQVSPVCGQAPSTSVHQSNPGILSQVPNDYRGADIGMPNGVFANDVYRCTAGLQHTARFMYRTSHVTDVLPENGL